MLRLTLGLTTFLALTSPASADFPAGGVADLRTQTNVEIIGAQAGTFAASTVAPAGDFNGDGADDVLVAAPSETTKAGARAGAVYVLFGHRQGAKRRGPAGIRISGPTRNGDLGRSVAAAGDFNRDGLDDIVIGAPRLRQRGDDAPRGAIHVVFGSRTPRIVRLAHLGRHGLTLYGSRPGARLGASVAGGRDVDGDGRPDVVAGLGLPTDDRDHAGPVPSGPVGSAVVLRGGRRQGTARRPDLTLRRVFPQRVGLVGDMNGDGRAEIVTGGGAAANRPGTIARVVFGGHAGGGFDVTGDTGVFRAVVSDAGDVDGDGRGDVLVSALGSRYAPAPAVGNTAFQGGVAIVHGKPTSEPVDVQDPGARGLVLTVPDIFGQLGSAVAPAGDLDGDGLDDVLVGAPTLTTRGRDAAGAAFAVFGSTATGAAGLETARTHRFDGEQRLDRFGTSVAAAGDFNADGRPDLVFGSPNASRKLRQRNGVAYVVYGR